MTLYTSIGLHFIGIDRIDSANYYFNKAVYEICPRMTETSEQVSILLIHDLNTCTSYLASYLQIINQQDSAIHVLEFVVNAIKKSSISRDKKNKFLSTYSDNIAYQYLFVNLPKSAISSALTSISLDPQNLHVYSTLALAYLLNDEFDTAKAIYLRYKGKKYINNKYKKWDNIFLDDIRRLEKYGIHHPNFKKVKRLMLSS
jgi:hypothetical protein